MATSLPASSAQTDASHAASTQLVRQVAYIPAPSLRVVPVMLPATRLAQMSRIEHDKLRLELREGMHRPVRVGPLDELGFRRLTIRERRLLREQLRRQSDASLQEETISVVANPANEEPRPETTDAAIATIAVPESVDVSSPVIESND